MTDLLANTVSVLATPPARSTTSRASSPARVLAILADVMGEAGRRGRLRVVAGMLRAFVEARVPGAVAAP